MTRQVAKPSLETMFRRYAMRKALLAVLVVLFCVGDLCLATAVDEVLPDAVPLSKRVTTLIIDPLSPETLYLGTQAAGVFKSTNGGVSWKPRNHGLPYPSYTGPYHPSIRGLVIDPTSSHILYAGMEGGVFKSLDGGDTWRPTNNGLPKPYRVQERLPQLHPPELIKITALAIDPSHPKTLYIGTDHGTFKSRDSGRHWIHIGDVLTYSHRVMAWAIASLVPTTIYGVTKGGVVKSEDGGETWQSLYLGPPTFSSVTAVAIVPGTTTTVYVGASFGGVFKTTNGGRTWSQGQPEHPQDIRTLTIDPVTTSTLYAGTGHGIYKSTDAGETWHFLDKGLTSPGIRALAIDPQTPATVYAGGTGGAFKSTNGGRSWKEVNLGLTRNLAQGDDLGPSPSVTSFHLPDKLRGGVKPLVD